MDWHGSLHGMHMNAAAAADATAAEAAATAVVTAAADGGFVRPEVRL